MVHEINSDREFATIVGQGRYVLINFYATWSGPCKRMKPLLDALSNKYPGVPIYSVDIDDLDDVATRERVSTVPIYRIYAYGKVHEDIAMASDEKVEQLLAKYEGQTPPPPKQAAPKPVEYDRSGDLRA